MLKSGNYYGFFGVVVAGLGALGRVLGAAPAGLAARLACRILGVVSAHQFLGDDIALVRPENCLCAGNIKHRGVAVGLGIRIQNAHDLLANAVQTSPSACWASF